MLQLGMPFDTQLRQSESKMINQVINFVPKIIGASLCFCVIHINAYRGNSSGKHQNSCMFLMPFQLPIYAIVPLTSLVIATARIL